MNYSYTSSSRQYATIEENSESYLNNKYMNISQLETAESFFRLFQFKGNKYNDIGQIENYFFRDNELILFAKNPIKIHYYTEKNMYKGKIIEFDIECVSKSFIDMFKTINEIVITDWIMIAEEIDDKLSPEAIKYKNILKSKLMKV